MKAISLWQPWVGLIAAEAKTYETRSWPTKYRGLLGVHAAAKDTPELRQLTASPRFQNGLAPLFGKKRDYETLPDHGITFDMLPRGALICVVEVTDCIAAKSLTEDEYRDERFFGDFSPERFAWKVELIEVFKQPIPMKGQQGFWETGIEYKF
jgi:hypothetical protein